MNSRRVKDEKLELDSDIDTKTKKKALFFDIFGKFFSFCKITRGKGELVKIIPDLIESAYKSDTCVGTIHACGRKLADTKTKSQRQ